MMTIDVETLRRWLEEGRPVTMLDVRPAAERAEWAIPGSIHVDAYDALKEHDPAALADVGVPSDRPVVTVCAAGKTSQIAAEQLVARDVEAMSLEGGMKAWSLAWNTAEVPLLDSSVRVIQVRRTGKGCLSYLIGADEEAVVIDASLDPQVYLDLAAQHGWQITRVLETHIHADHLSRSRQLADRSGARLILPDQQRVTFPFTAILDGERLPTETMQLTALRTPGHTPESACYLLEGRALFTGDTLFPTGVGPRSPVKSPSSPRQCWVPMPSKMQGTKASESFEMLFGVFNVKFAGQRSKSLCHFLTRRDRPWKGHNPSFNLAWLPTGGSSPCW